MPKAILRLLAPALILLGCALLLSAQNSLVLNQGYGGAGMVSGKASPGQVPVTIYDTSYPALTVLGTSNSIDGAGNFAVPVNPPLIVGHNIIAVDQTGSTSPVMVVAARPSSPSH